ncbi:NADH:ubiquinone oxidoreductase subunit C [Elusimicrobium posterum]
MLGVQVEGLPQGNRYPMQDDFPTDQHPLLKSWKSEDYIKQEEAKASELRLKEEQNLCQK